MSQQTTLRGIWNWNIVKLVLGLSILLYASFFIFLGFTEDGIRACIASSAKISFTFFCLAFSASAVHQIVQNSFSYWWLVNRKYFGIIFAISHLLHLAFLLVLQQVFHPVFTLAADTSLMAGGIAYFFLVLMLLTSFNTFSKYLSPLQWKWLHTIGGYWIWGIFLSTYSKRVMKGEYDILPFVIVLALVLGLRIYRLFSK